MKYQLLIVFLSITSLVSSKNLNHFDDSEDENESEIDFGWLLDNDNAENNKVEHKPLKVCKTNECEILGKEFLKGMNTSVNPCDDFYDFVCGAWETDYKIPAHVPAWSRPFMFQQTVYRRIKGILETEPQKSDILPVRQAKKWYRACMNTENLEKRGITSLESILMQFGGWPMTIDAEEWDENGNSWQSIEQHYFHLTGSHIFLDITPYPWSNSDLRIQNPELPLFSKLPLKYRDYTANKYDEYVELIENVGLIFIEHNKANITKEMLRKDIEDLVDFEKELYKINNPEGANDNEEYEYRDFDSIGEFIEGYDEAVDTDLGTEIVKINFRKLFKHKFDLINMEANESITLEARGYEFYTNLTELLNKTPKRTIVNYLHWFFVSDMLVYTTEEMRNKFFKYKEQEFGISEREPRVTEFIPYGGISATQKYIIINFSSFSSALWLECISEIKMEVATAYAFAKKFFSEEVEQTARKMIKNIQKEMEIQISTSNWMDQRTKDLVIDKLESIKVNLGIPDWFKNKTHITNFYKGLIIGYDHFDNLLSYDKYLIKRKWQENLFGLKVNRLDVEVLVVNAFYAPRFNFIELPAADFQPPLFTPQLPSVINYGSIGSVIGHEIGHAFDDSGIRYGKYGNRTEISKKVMQIYYQRAECFLDQFNNYFGVTEADYEDTTPHRWGGSRGRQTRGENIADSTGLHSVVHAYQNMRAKNPDVVGTIPGFEEYTDDQMFFISFGALWCEKSTPEYQKMLEEYDSHSPNRLRVIGAVSNTNDFAKAFNCPKGSPMNPEDKCNVWKRASKTGSKKVEKNYHHPWVYRW